MDESTYGSLVNIGFSFFFGGLFCALIVSVYLCLHHGDSDARSRSLSRSRSSPRSTPREIINNEPSTVIITIVPTGLNPKILQSIPIVDFNSRDFKDGVDCVVCISELVDGDKSRVLPSCNHCFHVDCIDMWLKSHYTCPVCRTKIRLDKQTESESDSSSSFTCEVSIESQIPDAEDDVENPNFGGSSTCNEV